MAAKAPLGDQSGCEASSRTRGRRFAGPPLKGMEKMRPWRSIRMVLWSGETVICESVASETVMVLLFTEPSPFPTGFAELARAEEEKTAIRTQAAERIVGISPETQLRK